MKKLIKNPKVILVMLAPIVSAVLFFFSLMITEKKYSGSILLIGPIEYPSVFTIAVLVLIIAIWGYLGFVMARQRATIWQTIILGNSLPIITTIIYIILNVVSTFLKDGTALSNAAALIGGFGMGLFNFVSNMLFLIIPIRIMEVFTNLILMGCIMSVGYAIAATTGAKTSKGKKASK